MVDLVIRQRVATADPAEASSALSEVLGAGALAAEGAFRYEQRSLVDDGITVTRVACSAGHAVLRSEGSADLVLLAVRDGRLRFSCRGASYDLGPQDLALIPFNESCALDWSTVTVDLYSFPLSSFVRTLGIADSSLTIAVPALVPRSADLTVLWHRLAELVTRQVLDKAEVYSKDVVRAQLTDGLTAVTVEAFGLTNEQEDQDVRDADVMQRADAYIRAHLDSPITVPEIAAAAGVSVRGLQLVSQRRLDSTPIAHLRRLRLRAAQLALSNPAPVTSVSSVGRRYGYSNLGRFSAHYRDEFGETPSATLDRSRRARTDRR